jgi:Zn-dependent oligopeptidase
MNPLLQKFNTKYNSAPFNEIKEEHYLPAFKELIEISKKKLMKSLIIQKKLLFLTPLKLWRILANN